MKSLCAALAILLPVSAFAATPSTLGPDGGKFGAWTAAVAGTGSAKVCYAFTTPVSSKPAWKSRARVLLTVTERADARDEVTLTPGYTYPKKVTVSLTIGKVDFPFLVDSGTAFATDNASILAAFRKADAAASTSTGPHGKPVADKYSLTGFSAAYKAIVKACP
jgi:hypothetical protein